MSKALCLSALLLTLLASCQSTLPTRPAIALSAMNQTSANPRETIGTAKELYALARQKATEWDAAAQLVHVEGNFISPNGRNDFPMDAAWTFGFINPNNRFLAYQVMFRSEFTKAVGQEIPRGTLKAQTPIDDKAWALDSSTFLQTAAQVVLGGGMFWTRVELLTANNQPVWQVPSANTRFRLSARDGTPVAP